ncbi:hypothetical protein [Cellvibrio sp.]
MPVAYRSSRKGISKNWINTQPENSFPLAYADAWIFLSGLMLRDRKIPLKTGSIVVTPPFFPIFTQFPNCLAMVYQLSYSNIDKKSCGHWLQAENIWYPSEKITSALITLGKNNDASL